MAIEPWDTKIPAANTDSEISKLFREIEKQHPGLIPPPQLSDETDKLVLDSRFRKYIEPFKEKKDYG